MTQSLTLEQSERCARACGWKREISWFGNGWWRGNRRTLEDFIHNRELPLDPHFWLPRLMEALLEMAQVGIRIDYLPHNNLDFLWNISMVSTCGIKHLAHAQTPCMALCEAIEQVKVGQDSVIEKGVE